MTENTKTKAPRHSEAAERRRRLADALRQNLIKRKTGLRDKSQIEKNESEGSPTD